MKITKVQINWKNNKEDEKVKGIVSITLDEEFVVSGIKIIEGKNGLFVSMPQSKNQKTNEYNDICFPVTKEFRETLIDSILEEFNK